MISAKFARKKNTWGSFTENQLMTSREGSIHEGKTTKGKMSGVQYSQFQAVASKILPIKWFPGQNSIRRKRQILSMLAQ